MSRLRQNREAVRLRCLTADHQLYDFIMGRLANIALTGNDAPPIAGTVDQVAAVLREYEAAGVERAMLQHLVHEDVGMVTVLGEVAAQLEA